MTQQQLDLFQSFGALQDAMRTQVRSDYTGGKQNRYQRRRSGLGGSGDAHYAVESQYDRMREYTRDMDRNDALVGALVDRAVMNQLQTGFRLAPDTGDLTLDAQIRDLFEEWSNEPQQCDHHWESTFNEICWYIMRQTYIDGDIFGVLTSSGAVQVLEADRVRSPRDGSDEVHGVLLEGRRKVAYNFVQDPGISHSPRNGSGAWVSAYDDDGNPGVLHVYNPHTIKRKTQTRGVTAFQPVFYRMQMYEDIQFAKLVQQQVVSSIAMFLERDSTYKAGTVRLGGREDVDSNTSQLEKLSAGLIAKGVVGEKATMLSPNIPNPEYFQQVRLVLTEVSMNIGLPLVIALMDASETNFSGWRGAYEQAKMGFRLNQNWFAQRFLQPVYKWKMRQWIADGVLPASAASNPRIMRHKWGAPAWPYIEPMKDAQANDLRLSSGQMSPAQWAREANVDWASHSEEIASGWGQAIRAAKLEAAAINEEFPDDAQVTWQDVMHMKGKTPGGGGMPREEAVQGVTDELVEMDDKQDEQDEQKQTDDKKETADAAA